MLVVGAGATLDEALKAADELAKENVNIRVLDPFTIKPIDKEAIVQNAKAVGGKILTVEDHYLEGTYNTSWSDRISLNYFFQSQLKGQTFLSNIVSEARGYFAV